MTAGEVFDALLRLSADWRITGRNGQTLIATRKRGSQTWVVVRPNVVELVDRILAIEQAEAEAAQAEAAARLRERCA
jgi:hypothetical protein